MVAVAKESAASHGWKDIEFRQSDATCLELPSLSLDGAISTFGLSAMPGERTALQSIAAALKPNAHFVALDAKVSTGIVDVFNPLIGPAFKYTTNWAYEKDVIRSIEDVFGEIEVEELNCGCNSVAVAIKH